VWDARQLPSGVWAIRRDGHEVATLAMLDDIGQQHTVAHHVAALLGEAHRLHHTGRAIDTIPVAIAPARTDWAALGWTDQAEHDEIFDDLARICRRYPPPVQRHLKRRWHDLGLRLPLSVLDMDQWDRIVRSAPQVVAQDTAAEHAHSPGAVA
jgi:hypothetical protein